MRPQIHILYSRLCSNTSASVPVSGAREQAVAIAKAGRESSQAMLAKYQQLATTINDKGDPSCANSRISSLVINEPEDLGPAHSANGDLLHIWVVHGAASRGEFWFIFAQSDPQTIA